MSVDNKIPKLAGEQCRVLYLPRYSNQIVLGVAGSGKSLEALYRAAWIAMSNPNDQMVLLSFNRGVVDDMEYKLNLIFPNYSNIKVDTIYNYFHWLINRYPAKPGSELDRLKSTIDKADNLTAFSVQKKVFPEIIDTVKSQNPDSPLWNKDDYQKYIQDEAKWMMDNAIPYDDINKYLDAEQIGRGHNLLNEDQKITMYAVYQELNRVRLEQYQKLFSYADIYRLIPDLDIPEAEKPKYLVVDEVQDVSLTMFNAMRFIKSDDGYWNVFGDLAQNIFGQRISWRKLLGISIKKIYRFNFNYRNSYQIGTFTDQILTYINRLEEIIKEKNKKKNKKNNKNKKEDNNEDNGEDDKETKLSDRQGPKPAIIKFNDENKLASQIEKLSKDDDLLIITMNGKDENGIKDWVKNQGFNVFTTFNDYLKHDDLDKRVLLQTINQVKGLEFDNVIVLCMDSANDLADDSEIIDQSDRSLLIDKLAEEDKLQIAKRIYVAASRAKNNLVVFYKNSPLNFILKELNDSYELYE